MINQKSTILKSITLSMVKGIGHVIYKKLIDYVGSAEKVVKAIQEKSISSVSELLQAAILQEANSTQKATNFYREHEKAGIKIIAYEDPHYPKRLKELYSPPPLLYYQGNVDLNRGRTISIVGTRNASSYGKEWVQQLVHDLKPYHVTIVSGLAYGIDICAHKTALEENIPTVAVLAGGLDHIYPLAHTAVAKKIKKNGAILSETPIGKMPEKYNFPARNRIITGISDAVVIVEAGEKSGALITAKYATELDREVFALPGDINKNNSAGCHNLVKNHQANLITNAQDLVSMMNWDTPPPPPRVSYRRDQQLSQEEEKIMSKLNNTYSPLDLDMLSNEINILPHDLLNMMLEMETKKYVSLLPGNKCQLYQR